MTENEAIREMTFEEEYEILKSDIGQLFADEESDCEPPFANSVVRRALRCIRKSLEEIQQYRAIGTVEEFKALKEKSVAKKPIERKRKYLAVFDCPTCNAELFSGQRYCDECGQAILDDYE